MKLFLYGFLFLLAICLQANNKVPEDIKVAFRTGSAREIATYLESKVTLTLLDDDDIYPRSEVEKKLAAFFFANKPTDFSIQFEGGKDTNLYAIGNLKTSTGDYRVTLLLRLGKISQLRIEKYE
jgi:hypothetical protein